MTQIFLQGITPAEFKELFLEAFKEAQCQTPSEGDAPINRKSLFSEVENKPKVDAYLTRKQVSEILQISLPTLHQYTKDELITSYRFGNKIRYKKEDIETALTKRNFGRRA